MSIIEKAKDIILEQGYQTIQWFEPESGHEPCVRFEGKEFDLIKMYQLFEILDFPILEAKRIYTKDPIFDKKDKEIGENWTEPFNELTFAL